MDKKTRPLGTGRGGMSGGTAWFGYFLGVAIKARMAPLSVASQPTI
jgi:hypothetical protein